MRLRGLGAFGTSDLSRGTCARSGSAPGIEAHSLWTWKLFLSAFYKGR